MIPNTDSDEDRDFGPDGFLDYDPLPYERRIRASYAAQGFCCLGKEPEDVIDTVSSSKPSEAYILAQLRPLERWRYLAKHNRIEFVYWMLALVGGTIMMIMSAVHLVQGIQ